MPFSLFLYVFLLTSGVPQKVDVVPSGSTPSLHRPKSVRTTWPYSHKKQAVTRIYFFGQTSLKQSLKHMEQINYKNKRVEVDSPGSLEECSLASDLCNRREQAGHHERELRLIICEFTLLCFTAKNTQPLVWVQWQWIRVLFWLFP